MQDKKQALRTEILQWRQRLGMPLTFEKTAITAFLNFLMERGVLSIGVYHALEGELDVKPMMSLWDQLGVSYALPVVNKDGNLHFQTITQETILKKKSCCSEPDVDERVKVVPDLLLIPGLAFDKRGNRLGFGKGHYDRYLENYKGVCVGVCSQQHIRKSIPVEAHDKKMRFLLTESEFFKI